MKFDSLDWSVIKLPIILFILVTLFSVGTVSPSYFFKENTLQEYRKQKQRFIVISQQYLTIDKDKEMIKQYYPEFIKLYDKGVVGHEQRLNWLETLRMSSERIGLPDLTYDISRQDEYVPEFNIDLGNFALYESTMNLNIGLLHEGDLLSLIADLNKHAKGMFAVKKCDFLRPNETLIEMPDAANIKANCELQWFNIRKIDGTEIKLSQAKL